jgi:hypothetical protein
VSYRSPSSTYGRAQPTIPEELPSDY